MNKTRPGFKRGMARSLELRVLSGVTKLRPEIFLFRKNCQRVIKEV
jgi:hypothetical protein